MADNTIEPGAPTPKAADEASDAVTSKSVSVPNTALSTVKQLDRLILRLNKLLSTPGGLAALLSTSNYILYILAHLSPKAPSITALYYKVLWSIKPSTTIKPYITTLVSNPATVPPIAALAGLLSKTRTTLRLLGCFPLYAWLRTLLAGKKAGTDEVLHRIATLQASSYLTFQALENVCLLTDCGVIPSSLIVARLNRGDTTTARIYLWAFRAWLGGISCDFLRLAREAQLESRRRATREKLREDGHEVAYYQDEQDKKVDAKWWSDFAVACAWFPMALHFSSGEKGLPGFNMGWMGVCGLLAGQEKFRALWKDTA